MWTNPEKDRITLEANNYRATWWQRTKRKLARFYRWVFRLPEPPLRFVCKEEIGITVGNVKGISKLKFD